MLRRGESGKSALIGHFGKYHNTLCLSPQILHKHCLQVLLGLTMVPRENKNHAYAKFGGTNKEYYGIFRSGLLATHDQISFLLMWHKANASTRKRKQNWSSWLCLHFCLFLRWGRFHREMRAATLAHVIAPLVKTRIETHLPSQYWKSTPLPELGEVECRHHHPLH